MKKISVIIMMIALSISSCSSDNGSVEADPGETDPIEEVPSSKNSYGSFSVNMRIDNKNVTYKYWNYLPRHREGKSYNDTFITMTDTDFFPSKDDAKYGDFPGGLLTININKPEPGLYTVVRPRTFVLANGKFPIGHDRLATVAIRIGANKKNYQDAKYEYIGDDYLVDAVEVTQDEKGVLHYTIKKAIPVSFIGGEHGEGNIAAPKVVTITVDNGHYKK
ncbi:hypothetical protein [Myroides odoratimimus]|uniref:hypothetical protein n=1 Tax=Myroides odoratimimus TaxID=76832 RepID=UPI002576D402|nr:hypothetical protein [Myroides odoratimimus]MDM1520583.1 hypothetical protein [Myroides odoratimimus]